jgi:small-conductance mechanosensitive channel/CRP-like cAMP-binding protein
VITESPQRAVRSIANRINAARPKPQIAHRLLALAISAAFCVPIVHAQSTPAPPAATPATAPTTAPTTAPAPLTERLWDAAVNIWQLEITSIEDRPITVGKVILGLLLLVVGLRVARALSVMLGKRILPHVGVNTASSIAFQRVFFYILLVGFTLFVLNLVNVPLTVFTVLGGAIAIGVGFGAQNIINNFISGWILLAERRVNIGDLIEVEGSVGRVRSIGARCTHVRRPDGIDLLIPNSLMLERIMVNWTLTDAHIRTILTVGVAYGSPTDKVVELIRSAAAEHDEILNQPPPIILFEDFGDSALVFDVHFWVHAEQEMDLRIVRSDLRFAIDRLFRAAGIVIAFPQRDVHLDAGRPLDVRMVAADEAGRAPTAPRGQRCTLSTLRDVDLFRSLDDAQLATLAESAVRREVPADDAVVNQGEPGASLFILAEGLMRVAVTRDGATRKVGQLLPRQFFGEMSLLTGEPRTATVTAVIDSVVFEIDKAMLAPLLQDRPDVVRQLGTTLARRQTQIETRAQAGGTAAQRTRNLATQFRQRIYTFFRIRDPE